MKKHYTAELNAQILISLLKQHGIKRIVASPGTTNMAFVASVQQDPWFKVFSSVDERSAAYIACGMAAESGEPVVISCTGATASRNYLSGMTEAYYRKLPVLAVTSTQSLSKVGHHVAQVIDRSTIQQDVARISVLLQSVKDAEDQWDCEMKANEAILELSRHGGGPAHINLVTRYSNDYSVTTLPDYRLIRRVFNAKGAPKMDARRLAVFIGSHRAFSDEERVALDQFCERYNGVVFCDHTSGYKGKYRLQSSLLGAQTSYDFSNFKLDLVLHLGEVSGDYYTPKLISGDVWRVSEDGEIRDTFKSLKFVFEMGLLSFLKIYEEGGSKSSPSFFEECQKRSAQLHEKIPEVPFSNIWLANVLSTKIPINSSLHFGILNSLRAWNFFNVQPSIQTNSNVGGFGIDGGVSSFFGAAQIDRNKLYFLVVGDLAFFYDMNVLGNRHLSANMRILLINNGKGVEFKQHGHLAESFGDDADQFISAAGHFGQQSPTLIKNYAEDLGFEYFSAQAKDEFKEKCGRFVEPIVTEKPMVFEIFTDGEDESKALEMMMNIEVDHRMKSKKAVVDATKQILGKSGMKFAKKILGR